MRFIPVLFIAVGLCRFASGAGDSFSPATQATEAVSLTASVNMTFVASGFSRRAGSSPQALKLSATRPAALAKAPEFSSPVFAELPFDGKKYLIAVDRPADKDELAYVDANNDGDLTNDPAVELKKDNPEVAKLKVRQTRYSGKCELPLLTACGVKMATIGFFHIARVENLPPQYADPTMTLSYYGDYGYDGEITLGADTVRAFLHDRFATGDFRGSDHGAQGGSGIRLVFYSVDDKGKLHGLGVFDATKPFKLKEKPTVWETADLTKDGSFRIVQSDKAPQEIAARTPATQPMPKYRAGVEAATFAAIAMDGKAVNFPADYRGKLVLIDFWATWCGPCMKELPGLVDAFSKLHHQGLEVISISIDEEDAADKIKAVVTAKGMAWPQIFDSSKTISKLYEVTSIPFPLLVDGDTGMLVASGSSLRGENLLPTLRAAVAEKAKKAKKPLSTN